VRNTIEEEDRYRRLAAEIDIEDINSGNDGNKENGPEEDDTAESDGGSDVDIDENYSEDDVGGIDDE
jgi:hypothetical protein